MTIKIKNWEKFQRFRDRKPPWIRLYRDILDDPEIMMLDPADFRFLSLCWLLAAEDGTNTGTLPDAKRISFRLRMPEIEVNQRLANIDHFLITAHDQDVIKDDHNLAQLVITETETETETETDNPPLVPPKMGGLPKPETQMPLIEEPTQTADNPPNRAYTRISRPKKDKTATPKDKYSPECAEVIAAWNVEAAQHPDSMTVFARDARAIRDLARQIKIPYWKQNALKAIEIVPQLENWGNGAKKTLWWLCHAETVDKILGGHYWTKKGAAISEAEIKTDINKYV